MANIVSPIWKDVQITLGSNEAIPYEIWLKRDGISQLIYNGVAQPDPEYGDVVVVPNDVCANYLSQEWTFGSLAALAVDRLVSCLSIVAEVSIRVADAEVANITFTYDWSYSDTDTPEVGLAPIDLRVTNDMYFPFTHYNCGGLLAFQLTDDRGRPSQVYELAGDEGAVNGLLGIGVLTQSSFASGFILDTVDTYQHQYSIVSGCSPYALYYVNAFGCWEALRIVSGSEAHNYERSTYTKRYNPSDIHNNRGKVNYRNDITRQWAVGTDWLTDAGAQNISHLIGSTNVWLHDIKNGELVPVIITDTASENKTFHNQGNSLVRYDINLQLAQDRTRR